MPDLDQMSRDTLARIDAAADLPALEAERVAALGKQGTVTQLLKTLGGMTPDERQAQGPLIHALRERVTGAIAERKAGLDAAELDRRLATETLDMYAFSQGFVEAGRISYAAAMAVCLMLVTNIVFSVMWRRVHK